MADLEKELKKLEKKHGKGKFEIDKEYNLIKKKGWIAIPGSELAELGVTTVARHLAKAEGKNPDDSKVLKEYKERLKKK